MVLFNVRLIRSFLKDREFKVRVNRSVSRSKTILSGVPQGSRVTPKLYNLLLSDFPELIDIAFFADDLAILITSKSRNKIQTWWKKAINKIRLHYKRWRLKINPDKTQSIFFTKKRKATYLPNRKLTVGNVKVEWLSKVKYLGNIFDKKLFFADHIW